MYPPCIATGVIPPGPSGPETTPAEYPHSKYHQSSHKIWCQKQMVFVSWVAEGVQRHGSSHCWVGSFLLSLSHCDGTMNVAVPDRWVVSSSWSIIFLFELMSCALEAQTVLKTHCLLLIIPTCWRIGESKKPGVFQNKIQTTQPKTKARS